MVRLVEVIMSAVEKKFASQLATVDISPEITIVSTMYRSRPFLEQFLSE